MKKIILILGIAVLSLVAISCMPTQDTTTTPKKPVPQQQPK